MTPDTPHPKASTTWILASLSLSMLLSSLGTSIANVALPNLALAFTASFQQVQWVVLSYLLAITTLIVSVGRLGDITGHRRLLLMGIALFSLASALCGSAPTLPLLIAARAAQGLGAAIMMALTMALVSATVPKARVGRAMGLLGMTSAIGTAIGPSLGGLLIALSGWRAIFLIFAPMGALTFLLAHRFVPDDRPALSRSGPAIDKPGTILLAGTLGAYALAMTLGRGQFGSTNIILAIAAASSLLLFVLVESRVTFPLVDLSLFRDPLLTSCLSMSMLVSTVLMATLVVGPFYLSRALSLSPAMVGLVMTIGPLVAALSAVPAGRLTDVFGAQRLTLSGLVAIAVGSFTLAIMPTAFGISGYVAAIIIITCGYAFFQTANNTAVMSDVALDLRGLVSGMLNLSRNLGLVTGASAMGAVFAAGAAADDITTAPAQAVAAGMRITFVVAGCLIGVALAIEIARQIRAKRHSTGNAAVVTHLPDP